MLHSVKEVIESLVSCNMGKVAFYNHEPQYSFQSPVEHNLKGYDSSDEFYKQYEPVLLLFGHGDYHGSDLDMANMRYVEQEYSELFDTGGIEYEHTGHGGKELVVFYTRPSVVRSGLFDDLEGLDVYPLIDDDLHSEIEQELLDEALENWGWYDLERLIEKQTNYDFTETDWQRNLFFELLRNGSGGEYHPEGTSMWIDFDEILSKDVIEIIADNAEKLDSGEFELVSKWVTTGYSLGFTWHGYKGEHTHDTRRNFLNQHSNHKHGTIPDDIMSEFGLTWHENRKVVWEIRPTNLPLKEAIKAGVNKVTLMTVHKGHYSPCCNCHHDSVMFVFYGENNDRIQVCPDCYNKLMGYWPKCEHCQVKNVNASLQLSLLDHASPLTHCQDCKNSLLST